MIGWLVGFRSGFASVFYACNFRLAFSRPAFSVALSENQRQLETCIVIVINEKLRSILLTCLRLEVG